MASLDYTSYAAAMAIGQRFYVPLATDLFDFGDGFITTDSSLGTWGIILLAQCSETCLIELNNYCYVGRECCAAVVVVVVVVLG